MCAPDPHLVLQALGLSTVARVQPVQGGADTLIWRVDTPAGPRALRVFRPEQAPVAKREAWLMNLLVAAGQPVPRVRGHTVCAGRPALLLDWVNGETVASALQARPSDAAHLGRAFGQAQAALHALPVPTEAPEVPPDWTAWAGHAEVSRRLRDLPGRAAVVHLDYHPLNVLVAGGEVSGIIDWANATVADPRADVARTLSILSVDPFVWTAPSGLRATLRSFRRAYLAGYAARGGDVTGLPLFLAWAGGLMRTDLGGRCSAAQLRVIERWAAHWRVRASVS